MKSNTTEEKSQMDVVNMPSKKSKEINIFVLLFALLSICIILTYFLPSGEYVRSSIDGRSVVDPESFHFIDSSPLGFIDIISSIPLGMLDAASIMFFVLIIGGVYGIINSTGSIEALIINVIKKLGNKEKLLIPALMLFFALLGTLLGMFEESLPYLLIIAPLIIALGYDVLTALGIVFVGISAGFTSAIMNPFTVGIAQGIAGLPPFSGMGLRVCAFIVMYLISVLFVYTYAMKVKRNPSLGEYGSIERNDIEKMLSSNTKLERRQKWILSSFAANLLIISIGVIKFNWFINEIAGMFIVLGIIVGLIAKFNSNRIVEEFMKGAQSILYGALIIGVARAIVIVLSEGQILDTLLYYAASIIENLPHSLTAIGMMIFDSLLHIVVPSGSGMAALTMPIMAPLADIVGITRQTAVLIFTFGDGIMNLIIPGVVVAGVALVGVSYIRWLKWLAPLLLLQYTVAIAFVIIANLINYGPY